MGFGASLSRRAAGFRLPGSGIESQQSRTSYNHTRHRIGNMSTIARSDVEDSKDGVLIESAWPLAFEPASHIGFGHRLRSDQVAVTDS